MITFKTVVDVEEVNGAAVQDFMLNCTDEQYKRWWPGTHRSFHTTRRYPGGVGNQVYFDEYVGRYRLKFHAVVAENLPGRKIAWQMKAGVRLPGWLVMEFEDRPGGVRIIHSVCIGYEGIGRALDPLLRLFFPERFEEELNRHAQTEFPRLGERLRIDS